MALVKQDISRLLDRIIASNNQKFNTSVQLNARSKERIIDIMHRAGFTIGEQKRQNELMDFQRTEARKQRQRALTTQLATTGAITAATAGLGAILAPGAAAAGAAGGTVPLAGGGVATGVGAGGVPLATGAAAGGLTAGQGALIGGLAGFTGSMGFNALAPQGLAATVNPGQFGPQARRANPFDNTPLSAFTGSQTQRQVIPPGATPDTPIQLRSSQDIPAGANLFADTVGEEFRNVGAGGVPLAPELLDTIGAQEVAQRVTDAARLEDLRQQLADLRGRDIAPGHKEALDEIQEFIDSGAPLSPAVKAMLRDASIVLE